MTKNIYQTIIGYSISYPKSAMNLWEMLWDKNPLNKWKDLLWTVAKEVKKTGSEASKEWSNTKVESPSTASDLGNLYKEIAAKLGPLMGIDATQLEQWLNGKDPALLQKFTTLRDSYPKDSELRKVVNGVVVARRTSNAPWASLMELIGENSAKAVWTWAMVLGLQKTVDELSKNATPTWESAYTNQSWHKNEDEHMHEGDDERETEYVDWKEMINEVMSCITFFPTWNKKIPTDIAHLRKKHPVTGKESFHLWIDLDIETWDPIYSASDWVIEEINLNAWNAWTIFKVRSKAEPEDIFISYLHCDSFDRKRKVWDSISAWDVIWKWWNKWVWTGSHLDIRAKTISGKPINLWPSLKAIWWQAFANKMDKLEEKHNIA